MFRHTLKKGREKPLIAMAPLIDMVFLLLVFFMVATVFPENIGVEVEKPKADSAKALARDHLLFAITKTGAIWHNESELSPDESATIIKRTVAVKPDTTVIIEVDRNALTDHLVTFLDNARKAGSVNIAIATEEKE